MKKFTAIGLCVLLGICLSCFALAEEITLTTYYPAPYGVYNEMRAKRMAVGTNYLDSSAVSVADNNLIVEGDVGVGTSTPTTKGTGSGYLDAQDVWLRDANGGNGRWASKISGGGGYLPSDVFTVNLTGTIRTIPYNVWTTVDLSGYGIPEDASTLVFHCRAVTIDNGKAYLALRRPGSSFDTPPWTVAALTKYRSAKDHNSTIVSFPYDSDNKAIQVKRLLWEGGGVADEALDYLYFGWY